MADEKPITADGYSTDVTEACERALVALLRGFGTLKDTLRLVGGLVPRYLTPEQPPHVPPHAGTSDVDIALNLEVLADSEAYKSLAKQLKAQGFSRALNDKGNVTSWRWQIKTADHMFVVVEFLQDKQEAHVGGRPAAVDGEDVSALPIANIGMVHEWYEERQVTAQLPGDNGIVTETVRYADLTSFIALKAFAFDDRAEPKDAADLVHVIRYSGGIEVVADQFARRYATGQHREALDQTLEILRTRFCDDDTVEGHLKDGPVKSAKFLHGTDEDQAEARELEQRNVAATVEALIGEIKRRI